MGRTTGGPERVRGDPVQGYLRGTSAIAALDCLENLHNIDKPALIITAGGYQITPPDHSQFMHALTSETTLELIPSQRRCPTVEMPDEFNPILRAYLDQYAGL